MTIFLFTLVAVLAAKVVYFHVTSGLIQTYWSLFTFIVSVMKKTLVPWSDVPQLAKSDIAYVTGDPLLRPFYVYEPKLSAFDEVIRARSAFSTPRTALADVLEAQYASLPHTPAVSDHISSLRDDNSFTVTTAHQPCLFLGPLYFIYKAVSTIKLARSITASNTHGSRVIPVFVLGSEDHDLEELNHVQLFNKKLVWEPEQRGPVGSIGTATMQPVIEELRTLLGESDAAKSVFNRINSACAGGRSFAEATQALLHDVFGAYGLVVLNTNDTRLKRHFIPSMKDDLLEQTAFRVVGDTIGELNHAGFRAQAAPREINLFYMRDGFRERIVREDYLYKVLNTGFSFTESEILSELETHPERFSPNVVLRPLFQEIILPNLAYVGGGGELAYWLERRAFFELSGVHFPVLVRRHSVMWLEQDVVRKIEKAGFTAATFFGDTEALIREFILNHASGEVSLQDEITNLRQIYNMLAAKALVIDPTLEKAVRAEEVKAVSALEHWEGRLVRSEKQKHETTVNQIRSLKQKLFPNNGLQERTENFIPYLLKYGDGFVASLMEQFEPFDPGFLVLQPED
jgi:bacillithiol biosynthesis cysteine-adding enzyme BshC